MTPHVLVLPGIHTIKSWLCFEKPHIGLDVVYVTKKNEKWQFRVDEVTKFSNGTLELIKDHLVDLLEQVYFKQQEIDVV